jgi:hypothetical protein
MTGPRSGKYRRSAILQGQLGGRVRMTWNPAFSKTVTLFCCLECTWLHCVIKASRNHSFETHYLGVQTTIAARLGIRAHWVHLATYSSRHMGISSVTQAFWDYLIVHIILPYSWTESGLVIDIVPARWLLLKDTFFMTSSHLTKLLRTWSTCKLPKSYWNKWRPLCISNRIIGTRTFCLAPKVSVRGPQMHEILLFEDSKVS